MKLFWEVSTEQAWTPIFYFKSFDMDSAGGKGVFGKEIYTSLGGYHGRKKWQKLRCKAYERISQKKIEFQTTKTAIFWNLLIMVSDLFWKVQLLIMECYHEERFQNISKTNKCHSFKNEMKKRRVCNLCFSAAVLTQLYCLEVLK